MSFVSRPFLIFFPTVFALMAQTNLPVFQAMEQEKRLRIRHIILLIASYVFYGWWDWRFCFLMLFLTLVAHVCALQMDKPRRKTALVIGVVAPLVVLGIFKYYDFFINSFCDLFGIVRTNTTALVIAVGISFYTFQSLSYTIDVYRGKIEAERDFVHTALYIAFFPQLVAGPIVKAGEFLPQLRQERNISLQNLEPGLQIMLFGFFKKVVIADNIGPFIQAVHSAPSAYSAGTLLLAAYAYFVQLYCDFSGYSDIAVGCAKCLGYDLTRNFDLPFISPNVNEFWRRWHISLSTWLTEYLYFPLGGSKKGEARTYLNILINMTVCGLWHGPEWKYVIWGFLSGVAQCAFRATGPVRKKIPKTPLTNALSIFVTFHFFCFVAIIFCAKDIGTALQYIGYIFTLHRGIRFVSFWGIFGLVLVWGAHLVACAHSRRLGIRPTGYYPLVSLGSFTGLLAFFLFLGVTAALAYTGQSPFIYFQF